MGLKIGIVTEYYYPLLGSVTENVCNTKKTLQRAGHDVFCSPVMKASFGITLLEAMAAGKPIVATENTGYKELLSPQEGFLVPQRDPKAFAETILRLIRDERLRRDMGANGRRKALRYSWDTVGSQICAYYAEILGG
jgi:phosphatidylinositol alpha-mannosyltransferase